MSLNERQKLALSLFLEKKKEGEIAEALGVSVDTVKKYIKAAKDMLAAKKELTEEQEDDLAIMTEENKTLKRELDKLSRVNKTEEKIFRLFRESIGSCTRTPREYVKHTPMTGKHMNMLAADWHTGESVDAAQVMEMNCFNINILDARVQRYVDGVINMYNDHETCYVHMLGDMVTGIIHAELMQGVCSVDQVILATEIATTALRRLATVFPRIVVTGVVGNHGRMSIKPNFKDKYNNFDYIFYKMLEMKFEGWDNIEFHIPKAAFLVENIGGYNLLCRHGDGKTANSLGIPLYAVNRSHNTIVQTLTNNANIKIDGHAIGHFHNAASFESSGGANILMSGSIKGTDEYAFLAMGVGGKPTQKMFEIVENVGVTWQWDFRCDHPSDFTLG